MNRRRYDVLTIGNALVDVLAHADLEVIAKLGLVKNAMTLVDEERAEALYAAMPPGIESSGGSAANTAAALASLGGRGAYIGKVRDDQLGEVFRHDIRALGVTFDTPSSAAGPATGRCLVFVTPDAHRTMQTYLGAASTLNPDDIDMATVTGASVVYLEGYLWDPPNAKRAFLKAARLAAAAGVKVALTLSDSFCVDRHRESFLELVRDHVDILFANEDEIMSLYQVSSFDQALVHVCNDCQIAALTRSEKGSVIVAGDTVHKVEAEPGVTVRDTTGAGDAYAAGFLYGFTHDLDVVKAARIGGIAAAEVISHMGPRPEIELARLVHDALGQV